MRPSLRKPLAALGLLTLLSACGPTIVNHGYRLDETRLEQIKPGISTREDVLGVMGSPSSVSSFQDTSWYYISQRSEKKVWTQDEILQQDVVIVTFDEAGMVRDVGRRDLAQAEAIRPNSDKTVTTGNSLTLVQEFFGNLGRFNLPAGEGVGSSPAGRRPPGG